MKTTIRNTVWRGLAALTLALLATACGGSEDARGGPGDRASGGTGDPAVAPSGRTAEAAEAEAGEAGAGRDAGEAEGGEEGHAEGEEHADDEARRVHLTPEQAGRLGVRVDTLESGSASSVLRRPATVTFDLDRVARVGPRIPSKVVRVLRDLGDRVGAGEPLALMSSVELGKAKAAFLTARARLETRRADHERERTLFADSVSSEADLLEAKARFEEARAERDAARAALRLYGLSSAEIDRVEAEGEEPLSHFRLASPVAGVVQRRDVAPGQSVGPGETPIHVASLDSLWIMVDAFERDVPLLAPGQPVRLTVRSLPGREFEGRTDWVSYELDPETRTLDVRAVVANADGALRAGMFGTAAIQPEGELRYAMVPVDAVQRIDGEDVVFVPGGEAGSFRSRPVRLGEEAGGRVEILSGLAPGDSAVVAGAFELMSALTASERSADHGH